MLTALLALALAAGSPAAAAPTLRLPAGIVPLRGALDLTVDPAKPRHSGEARYRVRLEAPTAVVWLHAEQELTIERASVGGVPARILRTRGFLGLALPRAAPAGETEVRVAFSGTVDRVRSRALYAVKEGEAWYAYTFFEPVDARRAFPCFDEPWAKIRWTLTLRVPRGSRSFANAPVASEVATARGVTVTFQETKPLPSYLVAFVVGPFDVVDGGAGGDARVPVRFIVPRGRGGETAYAASVTGRMIDLLEQLTGVPYPYEKCDVAVVPRFWGTMEHPGIVALGQPLTLIRPEDDGRARRERYANIAIHELAHHWFGDLVTMSFWDDTWLNESFGSWADAPVTDALEPGWRHLAASRAERRGMALDADVQRAAKRLREPVASEDDIEGSFDNAITYAKGASVLTMFEAFVGEERFRAAVRRHLVTKAHRTAATEDLLAAFRAELGPGLPDALRGFVEQPGVPLVTVRQSCEGGKARAVISQQRFLADGGAAPGQWILPLCVKVGAPGRAPERVCALVPPPGGELELPFCPEWLWPNAGGTGYWLSALPASGLDALAGRLDLGERRALADDARILARRGDLPVEAALSLGLALVAREDRLDVAAGLELLALADRDGLAPADRARLRAVHAAAAGGRARALGWLPREGDGDEVNALRRVLVGAAAWDGEDPALGAEARALAERWLADRRAVPAEVAWLALRVAARRGDGALFERILGEARRTGDHAERTGLLGVLGAFADPALSRRALDLLAPARGVPAFDLRDAMPILGTALAAPETRDGAWAFLTSRWDVLAGRLRADEGQWLLVDVAALAADAPRRAAVAGFVTARAARFQGAPRAVARALEEADAVAAARKRNGAAVSAWLAAHE